MQLLIVCGSHCVVVTPGSYSKNISTLYVNEVLKILRFLLFIYFSSQDLSV